MNCVYPARNFYDTFLSIKRVVCDIDDAKRAEYTRQLPLHQTVSTYAQQYMLIFQNRYLLLTDISRRPQKDKKILLLFIILNIGIYIFIRARLSGTFYIHMYLYILYRTQLIKKGLCSYRCWILFIILR